jgi:hypothetical protein
MTTSILTPEEIAQLARTTVEECDAALAELVAGHEEAIERQAIAARRRAMASAPFDLAAYRASRRRAREAPLLLSFAEHRRRRGMIPLSTATILKFKPPGSP